MSKLIRCAPSKTEADRIVKLAKSLPGVTYASRYMVSAKYHVLVSGEFTEEVKKKILQGHRNLAEEKK